VKGVGMAITNNLLTPSANLAAAIGKNKVSRPEAIKKIWDYIKKNGLQDSKNKRNINADAALLPLFGKKQVSMFELAAIVSKNLK
jgi:DNA topoisomerase-3